MRRPWLLPLVPLYAMGSAARTALLPRKQLRWPVISVGNLSTGGTGKTPFTIALARLLLRQGVLPDVLSRGYGRSGTAVAEVDPEGSAEEFGDEPLLIANATKVPVYVAAQRWQAGELAERNAAGSGSHLECTLYVHLLDDGFQHRQLARQLDIVLVSSEDLEDAMLPAGNLREGTLALRRAHILAVQVGDEAAMEHLHRLGLGSAPEQSVWRYRREIVVPEMPERLGSSPVVAFCGIARPEQFFSGLGAKGFTLAERRIFPDHHPFTKTDLEALRRLAASSGAGAMVTTAKDFYRLGGHAFSADSANPIFAVDVEVTLENEPEIAAWLLRTMARKADEAN